MACSSEEPRKNRHLTAVALEHAFSNQARSNYRVASDQKLAPGKDAITFDFTYDGGSVARSGRLDYARRTGSLARGGPHHEWY
jgi:hypothetical protein